MTRIAWAAFVAVLASGGLVSANPLRAILCHHYGHHSGYGAPAQSYGAPAYGAHYGYGAPAPYGYGGSYGYGAPAVYGYGGGYGYGAPVRYGYGGMAGYGSPLPGYGNAEYGSGGVLMSIGLAAARQILAERGFRLLDGGGDDDDSDEGDRGKSGFSLKASNTGRNDPAKGGTSGKLEVPSQQYKAVMAGLATIIENQHKVYPEKLGPLTPPKPPTNADLFWTEFNKLK